MQTERLLIRLIKKEDLNYYCDLLCSKKIQEDLTPLKSIEEVENFVDSALLDADSKKRYVFSLFYKEDKKFVGFVELKVDDNDIGELKCVVCPSFWNKGLGSEAMAKLDQFAVEKLELSKMKGTCSLFNSACTNLFKNVLKYDYIKTDLVDGKDYLFFEKQGHLKNIDYRGKLKTDLGDVKK